MKIAYILNAFPALYNTFTLNDMNQLIRKDHDVYVYSAGKPGDARIIEDARKLKENTVYFDDILVDHISTVRKYLFDLTLRSKRYNPFYGHVVASLLNGSGNYNYPEKYFRDLDWKVYALPRIAGHMKEKQIDVIHAGFGSNEATFAMILSEMTGIPFTFESHAKDLFVSFPFAEEKIKKAEKIFTISHYNKNYFVNKLNCPASKIIVKRVSCNRNYCDSIPETIRKDDLIISVCRLNPIKGLEYAIDALDIVAKKHRGVKYVIVGDGPLRDELMRKVSRLGLKDNVSFMGSVTNEQALDLISQAAMILMPSVIADNGDRDGIPLALIEAMYMKTPAVSSRVSAIPELIDDGVNGLLAEPGNVHQIAENIEKLLTDAELRAEMGQRAREKVIEEFNIEHNVNKMITAWSGITGGTLKQANEEPETFAAGKRGWTK